MIGCYKMLIDMCVAQPKRPNISASTISSKQIKPLKLIQKIRFELIEKKCRERA